MSLRTLIADDEPLAVERMRLLLAAHPDIEVVADCGDTDEVVTALAKHEIDLLFLDIEMPGGSGFDLFTRARPSRIPMVVFVTAFNEHAVRAFEVRALDYLLKPVDPQRLAATIARAREQRATLGSGADLASVLAAVRSLSPAAAAPGRLLLHNRRKDILLDLNKIEWIEAENYYTRLHLSDHSHLMRESIKKLEIKLDPRRFVRVHRSAIVNIAQVQEIRRDSKRDSSLLLRSGRRIRISKLGGEKLLAALAGPGVNSGIVMLQS
jgi:two-component system, LytTR family, response regulator